MTRPWLRVIPVALLVLGGCGPAKEATTPPPPPASVPAAEVFVREARRLHADGKADSALKALDRALQADSAYRPALQHKALLCYDAVMREQGKTARQLRAARNAMEAYERLERQGVSESDVYERLCELADLLGDRRTFLRYAKKNAELYPYDRQVYNLGVALCEAGDYSGAIRILKESVGKFPASLYIGGLYRQLGRAYAGIDRDQTAERTYTAGLAAVNARLAAVSGGGNVSGATDRRRLLDDKIALLLALKKLHQTYKQADRLRDVERQLKEAGYSR